MTALEVGAQAPDFELRDQHGQRVRLSAFRGSKPVVLVFFPSAFSPVCSSELSTLREAAPELERAGVELLTVSCDPMFTLRAFSDQQAIEFRMLSDFWPHGEVTRAYEVFNERTGAALRGTFLVDRDGVVRWSLVNGIGQGRDFSGYRTALKDLVAA